MYMPGLYPGSLSWTLYQDLATAIRALGHHFEIFTDAVRPPVPETPGTHFLTWRPAPFALDRWLAPFTRTTRLLGTARSLAAALSGRDDLTLLYVEIAYPYGTAVDLARSVAGWHGAVVVKPTGEDVLVVPEASYGFRRHAVPRYLLGRTLARSAGIRCISSLVVDAVRPYTDRPHAIIPSAVDNETIEAAHRPAAAHREFRARARPRLARDGSSRAIVLALGRLHPFKGLPHLVEALRQVPDADLVIAGPSATVGGFGDYRTYLSRLAEGVGVADRVRFIDTVPHHDVLATLAAADVLVVPSLLESMNKVCVEAAAVRTPFVVTNTTGVSTYLTEPGVGEIVPPRDPTALATAIRRAMARDWPRDDAATLRFVDRFAPATVAPALCDLFAEALERHERPT